jgi:hypothetical protein
MLNRNALIISKQRKKSSIASRARSCTAFFVQKGGQFRKCRDGLRRRPPSTTQSLVRGVIAAEGQMIGVLATERLPLQKIANTDLE